VRGRERGKRREREERRAREREQDALVLLELSLFPLFIIVYLNALDSERIVKETIEAICFFDVLKKKVEVE